MFDVDNNVEMAILNEGQMSSLFSSPRTVSTVVENSGALIETSIKMQIHVIIVKTRALLKVDCES